MSRIIKIKTIFEKVLPLLSMKATSSDNQNLLFSNISQCQTALKKISEIELFEKEIQEIEDLCKFSLIASDEAILDRQKYSQLNSKIGAIRNNIASSIRFLEQIAPPEESNVIALRVPSNIQFSEFSELFDDLDKLLNQLLVNSYVKGKVEFRGFESGSSWIKVYVGTGAALVLLSGCVNLIYNQKERQQTIEARNLLIQDLRIEVQTKEQLLQQLTEEVNKLNEVEFNKALSELKRRSNIKEDDHEFDERLKYSIRELDKWMDKGLEIHPSLAEPTSTQMLFPDAKPFLDSVKLLAPETEQDSEE